MKAAWCTIITSDFIHYALALYSSLAKLKELEVFHVLIADCQADFSYIQGTFPSIRILYPKDINHSEAAQTICKKYQHYDMDSFRWSMKPVLLKHLLEAGCEQAFFLDPDLYFYNSFDFLMQELDGKSVLLTPHWRACDPHQDPKNFAILQTSGLFNAGFVGVSATGLPAMEWWAKLCAYECVKAPERGLYVDQSYLDMMPVYFDGIKILGHRGCNVANWNQFECKRTQMQDGNVLINKRWEIVFIHFTRSTVNGILLGGDYLLRPYLDMQQASLERFADWIPQEARTGSIENSQQKYNDSPPALERTRSLVKWIVQKIRQRFFMNENSDFLDPPLVPSNLDRYVIRSSILRAFKRTLPRLHGVLLDVGCGQMPYKPLLCADGSLVEQYLGLDFQSGRHSKHCQPDLIWDGKTIPLDDGTIDSVIATEVFEHCPDPETVMKEIWRVLKPGGILFFTVPFLWNLHETPNDEYRYTPFSLERHLAQAGFSHIEINAMGGWDAALAQMIGLWTRRRLKGSNRRQKLLRETLSRLTLPLIGFLYRRDRPPEDFKEGTMIAGLAGTASK